MQALSQLSYGPWVDGLSARDRIPDGDPGSTPGSTPLVRGDAGERFGEEKDPKPAGLRVEGSSGRAQVVLVANAVNSDALAEAGGELAAEVGDTLHSLVITSRNDSPGP